jgi:hypothetical protein
MKKIFLLAVIFIAANLHGQFKYSVKFEPFAVINNGGGKYEFMQFYNFKFSIKDNSDSVFFYEIEPAIMFNQLSPNITLSIGATVTNVYFRLGIWYLVDIAGGGHLGPSISTSFLPLLSSGVYVHKNIFIEANYLLGLISLGVGMTL